MVNIYFLLCSGWSVNLEEGKVTAPWGENHDKGLPHWGWVLQGFTGFEMGQKWACVAGVTGIPAGYGGDGVLAAGSESGEDAKSQSKAPSQARPKYLSWTEFKSLKPIQKIKFCVSSQHTFSFCSEGLHRVVFRERMEMQLFKISAAGGNWDNTRIFR